MTTRIIKLLLLLLFVMGHSSALTLDHTFGPVVMVKSTPRSIVPSFDGNFVEFTDINDGCGDFDFIRVTEYNIANQVNNITQVWSFDLPCGSQAESFMASYYDQITGSIFFLTSTAATSTFTAYQASSTGLTQLGSFTEPSFSLTNIGLVTLGPLTLVFNANIVRTVDGLASTTAGSGATFWGATSDGTNIFVLGSSGSPATYYLAMVTHDPASQTLSLQTTSVSPTLSGAVPFGANNPATVVTFFYVQPLSFCAGDLRLVFTNADKNRYEVFSFSTGNLAQDGHFVENALDPNKDKLVAIGCNKISGRTYSLAETTIEVNGDPIFTYKVYFYEDMTYNETLSIAMGPNTLAIPRYVGLIASPMGGLYVHREGQQSVNTFTELYGQIFTNCGPNTYGPDCQPCLCIGGECDAGEAGTGQCLYCYSQHLYGSYCNNSCACLLPSTPCSNGTHGDGHCICTDPHATGYNCQLCEDGYYMNSLNTCVICPVGYYCVNSTLHNCTNNLQQGMTYCSTQTPTTGYVNTPAPSVFPSSEPTTPNSGNPLTNDDIIAIILGIIFALLDAFLITFGTIFYRRKFLPFFATAT